MIDKATRKYTWIALIFCSHIIKFYHLGCQEKNELSLREALNT